MKVWRARYATVPALTRSVARFSGVRAKAEGRRQGERRGEIGREMAWSPGRNPARRPHGAYDGTHVSRTRRGVWAKKGMSMGGQEKGKGHIGRTGVPLRRLMPRFEESRHGTYARTLYDACNPDLVKHDGVSAAGVNAADDAIDDAYAGLPRNVALLGGYGTGKSSIIQGFERYVRYEFRWLTKLGVPSLYTCDCFAGMIDKRIPHWAGRKRKSIALWLLLAVVGAIMAVVSVVIVLNMFHPILWMKSWPLWVNIIGFIMAILALIIRGIFAIRRRARAKTIPGYIKVSSLLLCRQKDSGAKKAKGDGADSSAESSSEESANTKPADSSASAANDKTMRYQADHIVVEVHPLEKDDGSTQKHSAKALDIQREVVKQLIYSVAPRIVDLSHFHRLRSRRSLRENLYLAGVPALGCALLMFLVWISQSKPTFEGVLGFIKEPDRWWKSPWLFNAVVVVFIACCLAFALKDRLRLSKVQAAAEGVSLSYEDNKANLDYFDKYLDEIIFLLEKANIRYVVFEDLDRADDMNIFYELRELNMLINSSTQMHNQTVTFIYVMGDDNFASAYGSPYETAESKAKFFDVNVYVRPFISRVNGIRMLRGLMGSKGE